MYLVKKKVLPTVKKIACTVLVASISLYTLDFGSTCSLAKQSHVTQTYSHSN